MMSCFCEVGEVASHVKLVKRPHNVIQPCEAQLLRPLFGPAQALVKCFDVCLCWFVKNVMMSRHVESGCGDRK